jgi:hypothetical protein
MPARHLSGTVENQSGVAKSPAVARQEGGLGAWLLGGLRCKTASRKTATTIVMMKAAVGPASRRRRQLS